MRYRDKLYEYKVTSESNNNERKRNFNHSLGYSRGMSGFGCTYIFVFISLIFSFFEIIRMEDVEEVNAYIQVVFFVSLIVFIFNLFEYHFYKKNLVTKERGIKVRGFISDIGIKVKSYKNDVKIKYYLIVEYTEPSGCVKKYKTPILDFDPFKCLGSKECSVYLYDGHVFVTDFIEKEGSEIVFFVEDYPELREENIRKKHFLNLFLEFLIPIVIVVIMGCFLKLFNII